MDWCRCWRGAGGGCRQGVWDVTVQRQKEEAKQKPKKDQVSGALSFEHAKGLSMARGNGRGWLGYHEATQTNTVCAKRDRLEAR